MEKLKKVSFKNAELLFEEEGIRVVERIKDEEITTDLETALRDFEGCLDLSIAISTKAE